MKAIILAAGEGQRMRPLSLRTPKPLLCVAGKPLLQHHLERLAAADIRDVVINVSWLAEQIIEFCEDGRRFGLRIHLSHEPRRLEAGGGIFQVLERLGPEPFLVVNGDTYTDLSFAALPKFPAGLAHMVLVPNPPHHPRGDFAVHDGRVYPRSMAGQAGPDDASFWTFAGICVVRPELFAHCRPGFFRLDTLLVAAMKTGDISGEVYRGMWHDVGTPERLHALQCGVQGAD